MQKFWNWIRDDSGSRVLRIEGPIDPESLWGTEITPKMFRDELNAGLDDITVLIDSPGGNAFAAVDIYTILMDYPANVTVRIEGIAASAATVVAMAGNPVQISPEGVIMICDPSTIATGNTKDLEKAISTLKEVKESMINAYAAKTGLSHNDISKLMSDETWSNAKKAVELGFADEIISEGEPKLKLKEKEQKLRNEILELHNKRNTLWERTKAFLKEHRDENGLVESSVREQYYKMTDDVKKLGAEIQRLEGRLLEILELLGSNPSKDVKDSVTKFIKRRFSSTDANWMNGNCYWFAKILVERFPGLQIYYEPIEGHFVAGMGGHYYDYTGEIQKNHKYLALQTIATSDPLWYNKLMKDCIL